MAALRFTSLTHSSNQGCLALAILCSLAGACGGGGESGPKGAGAGAARGSSAGPEAGRSAASASASPAPLDDCPLPAALVGAPLTWTNNFGGGRCPEGVCPQYFSCGCDPAGRIVFLENTYTGVPRERQWISYDAAGAKAEAYLDADADGRPETRLGYARTPAGTCVLETRDDDLDGTVERICRYDRECLAGMVGCEPRSCAEPVAKPLGHWCEVAACPPRARCSCDAKERVVQALFNDDQDVAYERTLLRTYRDEDDKVDEEASFAAGALTQTETFAYDERGHLLNQSTYHRRAAGGTPDVEQRWTWGDEPDWLTYERWDGGKLGLRYSRTYRGGQLLTVSADVPGQARWISRYFPGAPANVAQPITISPGLIELSQLTCRRDTDCVIVQASNCCPCTDGGGQGMVVNRRSAARVRQAMSRRCGPHPACPAVIGDCGPPPPPICVEQLCTVRTPGP
jgi:hypothetical protein